MAELELLRVVAPDPPGRARRLRGHIGPLGGGRPIRVGAGGRVIRCVRAGRVARAPWLGRAGRPALVWPAGAGSGRGPGRGQCLPGPGQLLLAVAARPATAARLPGAGSGRVRHW